MQYISEYWNVNRPNVTTEIWKPTEEQQAKENALIRECFGYENIQKELSRFNAQKYVVNVATNSSKYLQTASYYKFEKGIRNTLQAPLAYFELSPPYGVDGTSKIVTTGCWFFYFSFPEVKPDLLYANIETEVIPEYENDLPFFISDKNDQWFMTNILKTCQVSLSSTFMRKMLKHCSKKLFDKLNDEIWVIILGYCLPSPDDESIKKFKNGKRKCCSVREGEQLNRIKNSKFFNNLVQRYDKIIT